jgi:glutathione S-transferase
VITVHHLENSRSQRILWLLEELGLAYEVRRYQRNPDTMLAPAELRAVHPLGKSPVLTDGTAVIAESGAIIEYLIGRYGEGRLIPQAETPERQRYIYWLHFAEGSAMPPLVLKLIFDRIEDRPMPFFVRPVARGIARRVRAAFISPNLTRQLEHMENELRGSPWFAGSQFTAADIQMSFPVEVSEARAGLDARHPRLQDFLRRIRARPAYQRALQTGGPYKILTAHRG